MPRYEKYDNETESQAQERIESNKAEDMFMDEAIADDSFDMVNGNMSEDDVKEAQTALNLLNRLSLGGQGKNSIDLKVDGVLGPKTLQTFSLLYTKLPKETKSKLATKDNPLINVDGKNV
tara:strand:+ start:4505 stop:4864 length:360 start_codon:yes stop_codon:yes gene_type:complete